MFSSQRKEEAYINVYVKMDVIRIQLEKNGNNFV